MGNQMPKNYQLKKVGKSRTQSLHEIKFNCKTKFQYISPITCQKQQDILAQPQQLQTDTKVHENQYQEIENNAEQSHINSKHDLQIIEEIKVKWNQFIKMKKRNYLQDYSVLKQLGRGAFGCVHKVKARYTGIYRAAKRIKKSQLKKCQHQKLFEQMAIMISLDHPNIAKLYQVYDYKNSYVLILQLCEGGQLFKKIVTKQLNEDSAGKVMKQILKTLIYLHKKGIVHRDLKPQNMLFEKNSDTLKIIDFGIAIKKKPDQILNSRLGTPYYIAPQVLCKRYGEKCDIWSAGVILYMMISGYPPFKGDNQYQVMQNILTTSISFKGTLWAKITLQCKHLIAWMLNKNPNQRPSAQQAYQHAWVQKFNQNPIIQKEQTVLDNIRNFSFKNKLQAVVYTYIVSQLLTSQQKKFLFYKFQQLDENNDGVIETQELKNALKTKKNIDNQRVKFLMRVIDTNGSGSIDYTQFLVAGIGAKDFLTENHFQQAFQYFDIDHSGAITIQQIAHFLQDSKQSQESIKKIFQQVDQNSDGNISKEQFVKLLMKETHKKLSSLKTISENQRYKENKENCQSSFNNLKEVSNKFQKKRTNSQRKNINSQNNSFFSKQKQVTKRSQLNTKKFRQSHM